MDLVNRDFDVIKPNQLRVSDFTYVANWKEFVFVALVNDVFLRMIVVWRVYVRMNAELTLNALEQAIISRSDIKNLLHYSDGRIMQLRAKPLQLNCL